MDFFPSETWAVLLPSAFAAIAAVCSAYVAIRSYMRSKAPDLVAFLRRDEDSGGVFLVVSNVGGGCAWNVTVEGFSEEFVGFRGVGAPSDKQARSDIMSTFIGRGISMLAPGESRQTIICDSEYAKDKIGDKASVVTVWRRTFRSLPLKTGRKFSLDYYSFANTVYAKSNEWRIAQAVEKIAGIK